MHANPYTWRTSNMIYRYFTFISWLANLQRDVDLNNFILHYIILYNHLSEKLWIPEFLCTLFAVSPLMTASALMTAWSWALDISQSPGNDD